MLRDCATFIDAQSTVTAKTGVNRAKGGRSGDDDVARTALHPMGVGPAPHVPQPEIFAAFLAAHWVSESCCACWALHCDRKWPRRAVCSAEERSACPRGRRAAWRRAFGGFLSSHVRLFKCIVFVLHWER